ncbi:hypothetical protein [Streptomyces ipomoeae]|uniref:hypothetical protein n=1 Tax=Streptomyces ipomoeae TaxID=103232 RepID=UPI0011478172|nr:hypothetical protein [Streptomyces ipomoeae]TQE33168.1 hypothetical protein Sipo7851_22000 [Streptomyces ipomoeae]
MTESATGTEGELPDNVIPFRRRRPSPPPQTGRQCICGAFWRPGFSSNPAWLLTADPVWDSFLGVTHCHACGRHKLSVIFGRDMRSDPKPRPERST